MKRFWFCCFFVAVLTACFILLPQHSNAASQAVDFDYLADRGEVTITKWKSPTQGDVVIPETVDGWKVTAIGEAFRNCSEITSVTIPESVNTISSYAFENCSKLETVNFPENLRIIGISAFSGCERLEQVVFGSKITEIGGSAFRDCAALTSITIPDSVTTLGTGAFNGCTGLQQAVIGAGITAIGGSMFKECSQLYAVELSENVVSIGKNAFQSTGDMFYVYYTGTQQQWEQIAVADGNNTLVNAPLIYYTASMPEQPVAPLPPEDTPFTYYLKNGNAIITGYSKPLVGDVVIPDTLNGCPVTQIGTYAFQACMQMTSVSVPDTVQILDNCVFMNCTKLETVTVSPHLLAIGNSVFSGCSSLRQITLGEELVAIGRSAFSGCTALASVVIPDSVEYVGDSAFYRCSGLKQVTLGKGLTAIESYTFAYCESLQTVTIPQNVQVIYTNAFFDCMNLFAVELAAGITTIEKNAFCFDDKLFYVYYTGTKEQWSQMEIAQEGNAALMDVPLMYYSASMPNPPIAPLDREDTVFTYTLRHGEVTITGSKETLTGSVVIPETLNGYPVTTIGSGAFLQNTEITSVTIPDSVKTIGEGAFQQCYMLQKVIGGKGVTTIESQAFFYCNHITRLALSETVTYIGEAAFTDCFALTDVYYTGTQTQWEQVQIEENNHSLTDAVIHFEASMPALSGDLDHSESVDEEDVIYLLQHVLMPADFPVDRPVDYTHDSKVDEDDVIYLLQHVLMPEDFPV